MEIFKKFLDERGLNMDPENISYQNGRYLKTGNILILAGGAGPDKGIVPGSIIPFNGTRFDDDAVRTSFEKLKIADLRSKFAMQTGRYLDSIEEGDPVDYSILKGFVEDNIPGDNVLFLFFLDQICNYSRRPNLIMDVALKNDNVKDIAMLAGLGGYEGKKIHMVWIVNDFEVTVAHDKDGSGKTEPEITFKTNVAAAKTLKELVADCSGYRNCSYGYCWVLFKKAGAANKSAAALTADDYTAVLIRKSGDPVFWSDVEQQILDKMDVLVGNRN